MEKALQKIESRDVCIFLGLLCLGAGLWMQFGLGWSLMVLGALLFLSGWLSDIGAIFTTSKQRGR